MDAVGEGDRCPRVPKAVGREVRHLVRADSPREGLVDTLGVKWAAVGLAEDVVVIHKPGADGKPLLEHPASVIANDAHGVRIECDRPPARWLRLTGD